MGLVLAAIVAAAASFILGMLWYGPFFGKHWMALTKMKKKDMKPSQKAMFLAYLRLLITAFILGFAFAAPSVIAMLEELPLPVWVNLLPTIVPIVLILALSALSPVLWEKQSLKLYAINVGYEVASILVMVIVLTSWF